MNFIILWENLHIFQNLGSCFLILYINRFRDMNFPTGSNLKFFFFQGATPIIIFGGELPLFFFWIITPPNSLYFFPPTQNIFFDPLLKLDRKKRSGFFEFAQENYYITITHIWVVLNFKQ